ncbi:polysaccharide deacetylase family protein [Naumannella cuiyingiana]|uniref:Peptidoglycan/xylan/chitin deacetylase (PgdA/CDA1 family) n=1 Tax=Naumannella cuiyingiana TaxID=1347891 RepID=A0A7Z0IKY1_9ACTN|nr:polysaccharide deacetylase [Naumannella cuiyingiana]NYI70998.1 peptidoglycan/xylan/chitin deacetylase (PgdA/CDA1 family) [Naumannella cuiyingiana]
MTARWLGDCAATGTITFDVDAESAILAHDLKYADHAMIMSHQAYGPDVGVPRLLDVLDQVGIQATFFMPGWVAKVRPRLASTIVDRGHEVAHHSYSHQSPTDLTDAAQHADFERACEVFASQGVEIFGHRAAMWEATSSTLDLVREFGLSYDSSLMGDDKPYRISADGVRPLAELPVHWSLDDWEQYAFLPSPAVGNVIESPAKVLEMWKLEIDAMLEFGSLFNLTCHPFLSGRPSRAVALRSLIEYGLEQGMRFATCRDVAADVLADSQVREVHQRHLITGTGDYPQTPGR